MPADVLSDVAEHRGEDRPNRVQGGQVMVLELTIIPRGQGRSISGDIASLAKIIESSGLDYKMTAFGTLIEGTWDQLMEVAKNCHFETRKDNERVLTMMRLDDYGERTGEIEGAVDRVEKKLGRAIRR
jgi:uncharacterized protein (TIGR00106 family)